MPHQNASTGEIEVNDDKQKAGGPKADELHVKVWSPFQVYFDDIADSVSGINGTGTFDVLPQHHNFITLLKPCELTLQTRDGEWKIRISGGVMHVRKNRVVVFLEV